MYLSKYVKNVGIQSFIINQLKNISEQELRFILPQLCHLLISHDGLAGLIEKFLLEKVVESSHIAIEVNIIFYDL